MRRENEKTFICAQGVKEIAATINGALHINRRHVLFKWCALFTQSMLLTLAKEKRYSRYDDNNENKK